MAERDPEYLGDGVYASFDGMNILLRKNRHDDPEWIALEPDVIRALLEYRRRVYRKYTGKVPPE